MDEEFIENEEFFEYVDNGDLENVKKYVEEKNINPSVNNNEAIRWASKNGHLDMVKYLMSLDEKYNIDPSADNNYAIRLASLRGHFEMVKYLISLPEKYNIDPSAKDNEPIRRSSEKGHLEIVKYLMSLPEKYNIDPSANYNYSICLASRNGHLEVVKYLISLPRCETPSQAYGREAKKYNIDPSARDNFAIRHASENGHFKVVKYLMSLDEKYNIDQSAYNHRPICLASENGHLEVVKLLSTYYYDKLPINENYNYNENIYNYIHEFNKNPIKMNMKMCSYFFKNDLKYYSLAILFNDEYLTLEKDCNKNIKKFFDITKKLNHDILMLLINILFVNNKTIISSNDFNSFLQIYENKKWLFNDKK